MTPADSDGDSEVDTERAQAAQGDSDGRGPGPTRTPTRTRRRPLSSLRLSPVAAASRCEWHSLPLTATQAGDSAHWQSGAAAARAGSGSRPSSTWA